MRGRLPSKTLTTFLLMTGVALFYVFGQKAFHDIQSIFWPTTTGTIISSQYVVRRTPEVGEHYTYYVPLVRYEYVVHGKRYQGSRIYLEKEVGGHISIVRRLLSHYKPGTHVHVYYDPNHPSLAVLRPGYIRSTSAIGFFTGLFLIIWGFIRVWESHFFRTFYEGPHPRYAPETGTGMMFFAGLWLAVTGPGIGYGFDMFRYGSRGMGVFVLSLCGIGPLLFVIGFWQWFRLIRSGVRYLEILSIPVSEEEPYRLTLIFRRPPKPPYSIMFEMKEHMHIRSDSVKRFFPNTAHHRVKIGDIESSTHVFASRKHECTIPGHYPSPGKYPFSHRNYGLPHNTEWGVFARKLLEEGRTIHITREIEWSIHLSRSKRREHPYVRFRLNERLS